jgi:hypothetical protein
MHYPNPRAMAPGGGVTYATAGERTRPNIPDAEEISA